MTESIILHLIVCATIIILVILVGGAIFIHNRADETGEYALKKTKAKIEAERLEALNRKRLQLENKT